LLLTELSYDEIFTILSIIVQRDATISSLFIYCKVTLHVSGVVAPIIRST